MSPFHMSQHATLHLSQSFVGCTCGTSPFFLSISFVVCFLCLFWCSIRIILFCLYRHTSCPSRHVFADISTSLCALSFPPDWQWQDASALSSLSLHQPSEDKKGRASSGAFGSFIWGLDAFACLSWVILYGSCPRTASRHRQPTACDATCSLCFWRSERRHVCGVSQAVGHCQPYH